ncbi:putative RNA-directed DNA polymerase from mobile element jockey-like [Apostichopus japonicus]|uniref:Putative RNA-directed DNA polymerase from mobile element jockey-like n=1 Tax=Stichopus japonicus TaxID=307972 RepID=A0A2G8KJ40_STIJA|nr:putative RNA-directed DNA polymerase from mobile element jockey-like [Apostichopus japonicus]
MENPQGPDILIEEVEEAVKNLRNGKTPGCDGIRAEELKALDSKGMEMLTSLCNEMYRSGELPKELKHSQFITIPKKSNATDCTDYRTISLMSHVTKILLSIIIRRNARTIEQEIGDTTIRFRPGMGTREGLFNLRIILDKYLEIGQEVHICFIDYEKAFDSFRFQHKACNKKKNGEIPRPFNPAVCFRDMDTL